MILKIKENIIVLNKVENNLYDVITDLSKVNGKDVFSFFSKREYGLPRRFKRESLLKLVRGLNKTYKLDLKNLDFYPETMLEKVFYEHSSRAHYVAYKKDLWLQLLSCKGLKFTDEEILELIAKKAKTYDNFKTFQTMTDEITKDNKGEFDGVDLDTFARYINPNYSSKTIEQYNKKYKFKVNLRLNKAQTLDLLKDHIGENELLTKDEYMELSQKTYFQIQSFMRSKDLEEVLEIPASEVMGQLYEKIKKGENAQFSRKLVLNNVSFSEVENKSTEVKEMLQLLFEKEYVAPTTPIPPLVGNKVVELPKSEPKEEIVEESNPLMDIDRDLLAKLVEEFNKAAAAKTTKKEPVKKKVTKKADEKKQIEEIVKKEEPIELDLSELDDEEIDDLDLSELDDEEIGDLDEVANTLENEDREEEINDEVVESAEVLTDEATALDEPQDESELDLDSEQDKKEDETNEELVDGVAVSETEDLKPEEVATTDEMNEELPQDENEVQLPEENKKKKRKGLRIFLGIFIPVIIIVLLYFGLIVFQALKDDVNFINKCVDFLDNKVHLQKFNDLIRKLVDKLF